MGTICVSGVGKVAKQPDAIRINVSVFASGDSVSVSKMLVNDSIEKVKEICKSFNIDSKDLHLTNYKSSPVYHRVEDLAKGNKEVKNVLAGYRTDAGLSFMIDYSLENMDRIMDHLSRVSNINYSMNYSLKDSEQYKKEVLVLAVKNATETAKCLADAAGVKIGKIEKIDYSWAEIRFERNVGFTSARVEKCCSAIDDLGVEDLVLEDTVNIIFETI